MKLFFCPDCGDVIRMLQHTRQCFCRESWGRYMPDGEHAEIGGKAVPLGFVNSSLSQALTNRPEAGQGERFTAFVIPKSAPKIRVVR
jgi:hypothetical protein